MAYKKWTRHLKKALVLTLISAMVFDSVPVSALAEEAGAEAAVQQEASAEADAALEDAEPAKEQADETAFVTEEEELAKAGQDAGTDEEAAEESDELQTDEAAAAATTEDAAEEAKEDELLQAEQDAEKEEIAEAEEEVEEAEEEVEEAEEEVEEAEETEETELSVETEDTGDAAGATYALIPAVGEPEKTLSCGFHFDDANNTAKMVRMMKPEESTLTSQKVTFELNTVSYNGIDYRIVEIYNKAGVFGENLKDTKIDGKVEEGPKITIKIGANVKSIGENAFYQDGICGIDLTGASGLESIGKNAFKGNTKLEGSVSIPAKVTKIDDGAFEGTNIESFTFVNGSKLSNSVDGEDKDSLGEGILRSCAKLGTADLPENVKVVPKEMFYGCKELSSLTLPTGLTVIQAAACKNCAALTGGPSFLPVSVTSIGEEAFRDCAKMASLEIPSGVSVIENNTFNGCAALETLSWKDPTSIKEIRNYAFKNCSKLVTFSLPNKLEKLGTEALSGTVITGVTVPASLTFADKPFKGCKNLVNISFDDAATSVVDTLFYGLLKEEKKEGQAEPRIEVLLGENIKTIGKEAFSTGKIDSIVGEAVTAVGQSAFKSCSDLTSVTLLSVKTMDAEAFSGCSRLTNMKLPNLEQVPAGCFANCASLVSAEVNVATVIGEAAFRSCNVLQRINFSSEKLTEIQDNAFFSCGSLVKFGSDSEKAGVLDFSNKNVTKIGANAFMQCSSITELSVGDKMTSIGTSAFGKLETLSRVSFGDKAGKSLTLGANAFEGCSNLEKILFTVNVKEIGNSAFKGCTKLMDISFEQGGVETIGDSAFSGCGKLEGYSESRKNEYKSLNSAADAVLTIPASVTAIGSKAFENCYSKVTENSGEVEYGLKKVVITSHAAGSTVLIGADAFKGCALLKEVVLGEGVTGLGAGAVTGTGVEKITIPATFVVGNATASPFAGLKLKEILFAEGIQEIPQYFLNNITTVSKITIPASVTTIGTKAFEGCTGLTDLTITEGSKLREIGNFAFKGCDQIKLKALPDQLVSIGEEAFMGCSLIPEMTIASDVLASIGKGAFSGCFSMEKLSITAPGLKTIGEYAFKDCSGLKTIFISANTDYLTDKQPAINQNVFAQSKAVTGIELKNISGVPKDAFNGCSRLASVKLTNVASVAESAFDGCAQLGSIALDTVGSIGKYAFRKAGADLTETTDTSLTIKDIPTIAAGAFSGMGIESADITGLGAITLETVNGEKQSPFAGGKLKKISFKVKENSTKAVLDNEFIGVKSLESITLANDITQIGSSAFEGCESLKTINLGNVTTTGTKAFYGCESLDNISLENMTSLGSLSFYGTGVKEITVPLELKTVATGEITKDGVKTIYGPFGEGSLLKVTYADGYTTTNGNLLVNTASVKEVVLPNTVTSIAANSFKGCSGLEKLVQNEKENELTLITSIAQGAFNGCSSLKKLSLSGIDSIAGGSEATAAFGGCTSLGELTITGSLKDDGISPKTTIEGYAFTGCTGIKTLTLKNIDTIGIQAFRDCGSACDSAQTALTLENINYLGKLAFYHCGYKSVKLPALVGITSSGNNVVDEIAYGPFGGGALEKLSFDRRATSVLPSLCLNTTSLKEIDFSQADSLVQIGEAAFSGCIGLESIDIPDSVKTIGNSAFESCSSLTQASIGATTIGAGAFGNCEALTELILRNDITSLSAMAFSGSGIDRIELPNEIKAAGTVTVNGIAQGPFANTKITKLRIKDDTLSEAEKSGCALLSPEMSTIPANLFSGCETLVSVQLPSNITSVGANAFKDAAALSELSFQLSQSEAESRGITSIGANAFEGCIALKQLELPKTLTTLGAGAFKASALESVDMSALGGMGGTYSWGDGVFQNCSALTAVSLPNTAEITAIPKMTFSGCSALTGAELVIGERITTIGQEAFAGAGLTEIYLPNQITTVGNQAFKGCQKLSEVHLSTGMSVLAQSLFEDCSALEKIELPAKITTIQTKAFFHSGIKDVTVLAKTVTFGGNVSNTLAGANTQLSVFESSYTLSGTRHIHIMNEGFTLRGLADCSANNYYRQYAAPDKSTLYQGLTDSESAKGTIEIFSGSYNNENTACMKWESLDESLYEDRTVSLNQTELSLTVGKKANLVAVVKGSDDSEADALEQITWSTSNAKVATVSEGVVTAVSVGTAVITATLKEGVTATCTVNVNKSVKSFSFTSGGKKVTALALEGGEAAILTAETDTKSTDYIVSVDNPAIISYDAKTGELKALRKGTANIWFKANDEGGYTQSFPVTVNSTQYVVTDISKLESPHNYDAQSSDSWVYRIPNAKNLHLTFNSDTLVEKDQDFIYIFDASGEKVYDITQNPDANKGYTGDQLAGKTIVVPGDTVRIQLVSPDSNVQLYGFKVEKAAGEFKLIYKINGGKNNSGNKDSFLSGEGAVIELLPPSKDYSTFDGWYLDSKFTGEAVTELPAEPKEYTVYAKWLDNPYIEYRLNDGLVESNENPSYVQVGNAEIELKPVERPGYKFVGWYKDSAFTESITKIPANLKEDMILYAKWEKLPDTSGGNEDKDPSAGTETDKKPQDPPAGTGTGTGTPQEKPQEKPQEEAKKPAAGETVTAPDSKAEFKVTNADEKNPTVEFTASTDKGATKVTVPDTITVNNVTYKVTSIAPGAFKKNTAIDIVNIPLHFSFTKSLSCLFQ